ncbi:MAG: hypothetical protein EWV63_18655 [Microcystis aeruginosa Ma_OC_H_19870700_S124]|uniref:Uncharacterized protein n=1 Tax=Microcystis aeruginosa Ma_OC_H_19870700_S124 TaxID=2486262 RepID=A0A552ABQ0_MICAE|nr:MAG: hypothetical protein EWV63_18655 [Microcystis aeruginosa Ma_OC_H_19870700_S124]
MYNSHSNLHHLEKLVSDLVTQISLLTAENRVFKEGLTPRKLMLTSRKFISRLNYTTCFSGGASFRFFSYFFERKMSIIKGDIIPPIYVTSDRSKSSPIW